MNDFTNRRDRDVMPHDGLDGLLREWHEVNAGRAQKNREALMQRLATTREPTAIGATMRSEAQHRAVREPAPVIGSNAAHHGAAPTISFETVGSAPWHRFSRAIRSSRFLRAASSFALLATLLALFVPFAQSPAVAAHREIMLPDGGKLEARAAPGQLIGPCALAHTDVHINVSGTVTRVTVDQEYHNPYDSKIEAVYTFPLSNRAAVDRMSMTISDPGGERVIEAEMKERQQARQIYESARSQGNVA